MKRGLAGDKIRDEFSTGIFDEMKIELSASPAGTVGTPHPITLAVLGAGASSKDDDYAEEVALVLRDVRSGRQAAVLPVFQGKAIGSDNAGECFKRQKRRPISVLVPSRENIPTETARRLPDAPGTYQVGLRYRYSDGRHLKEANRTQTTRWIP